MSKIVYLFDEATNEFKSEYTAQESPLEKGVFITPLHSTALSPLAEKKGFAVVFQSGEWVYIADNRGEWYQADGTAIYVDSILTVIDSAWSKSPPPPKPQDIINGLISQVQAYIDSVAIKAGYDNANSCIGYMNSTNATWKASAIAMNAWRDAVWTFAFNEKSLIMAGTLPVPTQAQLVAALPAAPW